MEVAILSNNKIAMNKYIGCEECDYQECCHDFDAFSGCNRGKYRQINRYPLCNEVEDMSILCDGPNIVNRMLGIDCEVFFD